MDAELLRMILVNAPNYMGFLLLAYQQAKIINTLLQIVERRTDDEK